MIVALLGTTAFVALSLKKLKVVQNKSSFFNFQTSKQNKNSCSDLIGTWKNQLNSNLTIESIDGNSFTGGYHTAVESTPGAARFTSKVSGMIVPTESGKLIGFNVLWNKGESLTAWVGQCLECDGKEYIFTTWILRSYQPTEKRWMTTRINQDTFWKISDETGSIKVKY